MEIPKDIEDKLKKHIILLFGIPITNIKISSNSYDVLIIVDKTSYENEKEEDKEINRHRLIIDSKKSMILQSIKSTFGLEFKDLSLLP